MEDAKATPDFIKNLTLKDRDIQEYTLLVCRAMERCLCWLNTRLSHSTLNFSRGGHSTLLLLFIAHSP